MGPFIWIIGAMAAGLVAVVSLLSYVGRGTIDHSEAKKITHAIEVGAMTFLREEYTVIGIVVTGIAAILGLASSWLAALCFASGAALSLLTGFIGMRAATRANGRVALAAKNKGERAAFLIAFFGGGVMGFTVASLGLLGIAIMLAYALKLPQFELLITSFRFVAAPDCEERARRSIGLPLV